MLIDVDRLREHMLDYCGTSMLSGFPAAALDLAEVEDMDPHELCERAEDMGIDLRRFEADEDDR